MAESLRIAPVQFDFPVGAVHAHVERNAHYRKRELPNNTGSDERRQLAVDPDGGSCVCEQDEIRAGLVICDDLSFADYPDCMQPRSLQLRMVPLSFGMAYTP